MKGLSLRIIHMCLYQCVTQESLRALENLVVELLKGFPTNFVLALSCPGMSSHKFVLRCPVQKCPRIDLSWHVLPYFALKCP